MTKTIWVLLFIPVITNAYTAKITYMSGDVQVGTKDHYIKATPNQVVQAHQFVKTGKNSTAIITTDNDSQLKLKDLSELELSDPTKSEVFLYSGALFSKIKKAQDTHFKVRTKTAVMGVRGTQFYTSYGVEEKQKQDVWMCVNEGLVAVETADEKTPVMVKEGLGVFVPTGKKVTEPKPYAWTKELNWNMDPNKGDVVDHTEIKAAYGNLIKYNYD
jgi:ferric-dicitrate binding protein FerR (iron transport regulator)